MRPENHTQARLLVPMSISKITEFSPDYTPIRMMRLGVFGGNYFANADNDDFLGLLPGIISRAKRNRQDFSNLNNCFGTNAGLDYNEWMKRGWIADIDPLGWFHWYCRYYSGRRCYDDKRQISRYNKYRQRWGDRAHSQLKQRGKISPTIMQGLLQWSIDPFVRFL